MSRKKIILLAVAVVVVVLLLIPFLKKKPAPTASVKAATPVVATILNSVSATGTVEPIEQVEVGTQVSGIVDKVYVEYNSVVKKGQLLAEIDKSTLKARLLQSKASLAAAENELTYQTQNFNRTKKLAEAEMVSETEYESALYKLNNAKTTVDRLKSEVEQAEVNLYYAEIYSPIDGVVLDKAVEVGQTVAASFNTPTMFTIAKDLKQMQVEAAVDEADIGQVAEGQRVEFSVDAYPGEIFTGTVTQVRLMPVTNNNVVTYTVIIDAPNPELKLKPGLTAVVTIITSEKHDVLTIPQSAIGLMIMPESLPGFEIVPPSMQQGPPKRGSSLVWIKEGNKLQAKFVETGVSDRANVEVLGGIAETDSIVISVGSTSNSMPMEGFSSPFMPGPPRRR
jgi:HlyD family secretion protein